MSVELMKPILEKYGFSQDQPGLFQFTMGIGMHRMKDPKINEDMITLQKTFIPSLKPIPVGMNLAGTHIVK